MTQCIQCEKTDQHVPLLQMVYRGGKVYICPQCLPVLIHKPANLREKLPGLENLQPAQPDHAPE
jgi:hypothetical protein